MKYLTASSVCVIASSPQNTVSPQTPQRGATRERRQRSNEERRDGSGRRRAARNRNSSNLQTPAVPQVNGTPNGNSGNQKIDLPSGYGKIFVYQSLSFDNFLVL